MSKSLINCLAAVLLLSVSSCERPFVEETPPEISIVNPNADQIQTARSVLVNASVSSQFRDIESVTLNSVAMEYIQASDSWRGNLDLVDGANTFVIQAKDTSGLVGRLESTYLHYIAQFSHGEDLPLGRGGHSVSPNPNQFEDEFLLIGGSQSTSRDAVGDIVSIRVIANEIIYQNSENGLNFPRAGHTATRMNDGNTLIIGGSKRAEARNLGDLVESVERYNNETQEVEILPFEGQAIRRSRHAITKIVTPTGREIIYLLGGQGDIRYGNDPHLGIRNDLRLFEYRNDSLVAIPPEPIGTRFVEAVAGHSMVALNLGNGSGYGKYIVSSTEFDSSDNFSAVHSEIEINENSLTRIEVESSFQVPRTEYAAARFSDGNVGFFGGRGFAQNTSLETAEIYSARTLQYYLLAGFPHLSKERWDLTATKLQDGRILLTGGFDNSGNALRNVDFFSIL